jgi:enoyl-CoA hydratase/carnithine racemase
VLRINDRLPLAQALQVESLAYSALLGGGAFRAWREAEPIAPCVQPAPGELRFEREDDHVTLTLAQPDTRNAMTAAMRDALFDALAAVLDDPSAPRVTLRGDGACFSTGGHLDEFGANPDLAQAHTIRTMRSIARLIDELGARIEVVFHGACIGSGLEGPAAAAKRTAREGAFFQLPELKMGLIPGAGGTATIPRAIGRHRACAMMLGGARVGAATALEWGLVHNIAPHP